jgi:hypothetical protein
LSPETADTKVGAPNIDAIPAATPIINPQDTFPVKKPSPKEIITTAAKAFPPFDVAMEFKLQIFLLNVVLLFRFSSFIQLQPDVSSHIDCEFIEKQAWEPMQLLE